MAIKPRICGIVAEYNPFHCGHGALIREARRAGMQAVAVVMSGNFVQRGEPALFYKWARAKAALLCGADLVLELPVPWAVAGAEAFAHGAVFLLDALGCADMLAFGSECGDAGRLRAAARAVRSPLLKPLLHKELKTGASFAQARQAAVERLADAETAGLFREPNNILGIEYCKALDALGSGIEPFTVGRIGSRHDAPETPAAGKFASSSQIRRLILNGEPFEGLIPEAAAQIARTELESGRAPATLKPVETAILAKLRCMGPEELALLPDVSEGLENRIYAAAREAVSLEDLYGRVKSKRYAHARIRRIVLSAFLGLERRQLPQTPPYLRVLGHNERGREILHAAKRTARLPIMTNASDILSLDKGARDVFELENRAADLFALCVPRVQPCGLEMTRAYWERMYLFGYSNQRDRL